MHASDCPGVHYIVSDAYRCHLKGNREHWAAEAEAKAKKDD